MKYNNPTQRQLKVSEEIKRTLAQMLQEQIIEGARGTIVTEVRTSADLKLARVFISTDTTQNPEKILERLEETKHALRHELGKRLHLKYLPSLSFQQDTTVTDARHIESLLNTPSIKKDLE